MQKYSFEKDNSTQTWLKCFENFTQDYIL